MKEKKTETHEEERPFWLIGIALIIFLLLVLGSIIGLKMVRDRAGNLTENGNPFRSTDGNVNYVVTEDGLKENINEGITKAEKSDDNIRFFHFKITEGEIDGITDTDITFDIENMDEKQKKEGSFLVTLADAEDNVLIDFTVRLENLPPREIIPFRQNLNISCVNAVKVNVQKISGEIVEESLPEGNEQLGNVSGE